MSDKIETMTLPVTLTPSELADRSEKLARALRQRGEIEVEAALVSKRYKGQIADKTGEIDKLASAVETKSEEREVVVTHVKEPTYSKTMVTIRQDTGAEVSRRPLTAFELNEELPFEPSDEFPSEIEAGRNEVEDTRTESDKLVDETVVRMMEIVEAVDLPVEEADPFAGGIFDGVEEADEEEARDRDAARAAAEEDDDPFPFDDEEKPVKKSKVKKGGDE